MSGFELERQSLSEKLTRVTEVSKRLTGDEMNRELLSSRAISCAICGRFTVTGLMFMRV